jgi:hypothetical protein
MTYSSEIFGTPSNDTIHARDAIVVSNDGGDLVFSYGNTLVYGERGNDVAVVVGGNATTQFVGGPGIDTLEVQGRSADYNFFGYKDGIVRVDMKGAGQPLVEAWGVEIVKFQDKVAFNLKEGNGVVLTALYQAGFDRNPDAEGMEYWMESGHSKESLAALFVDSPEGQRTFGGLSNKQFVEHLYHNVLDRNGDADGVSYWTGRLDAGVARSEVLLSFADSQENVSNIGMAYPNDWAVFA